MPFERLILNGCTVDLTERVAVRVGSPPVRLTDREVALLRYMAQSPGQAVPVEVLERDVWGFSEATVSRAVSATVRRLRPKIEPFPGKPVNLPTVFGVGWRLMVKSSGAAAPAAGATLDLPARPSDRLVGRRDLIDTVARAARDTRWVSMVGPGGVGKSRLLVELAHRLSDDFDRVLYVDVAEASPAPGAAYEAVATAIGLAVVATPDVLARRLRDEGPMLLVLDYQGSQAPSAVVPEWLAACPELSVLTAGRASLGHAAEHVHEIPPLVAPALGATPEQVRDSTAFELLALRARAAGATVRPDEPQLVELLRALDGLPLALELAARRLRVLPPAALVKTLDRPEVLTDMGSARPERHQSLERVVHASWDAVGPKAQRLLSALCVFEGPFSLSDAAAAAGSEPIALADPFEQLVSHSLLAKRPASRFAVLRTVRAFVLRHRPPTEAHRAWHARWATAEVRPGAHLAPSPREVRQLMELRAAVDGADHPDVAVLAGIGAARVLRHQGLVDQAHALVLRLPQPLSRELRAGVIAERISCLALLGRRVEVLELDRELAGADLPMDDEAALSLACEVAVGQLRSGHMRATVQRLMRTPVGDATAATRARALRIQAAALFEAGRLDAGLSCVQRGVRIALDHRLPAELAWLQVVRADHVGGVDAVSQAMDAVDDLDDAELDPASRSLLLVGAGSLAWQAGRGKDALQWLERGVAAAVADGHLPGRQFGLLTMAGVLIDQGRLGGARAAIAESYETVPSADSVSWLRFEAGRLELSQGHLGHAEAHITRAIELVEPSGSAVSQVWNHEILALIRLAQGRLDSAGSAARRALDIARGLEATRFGATPLAVLGRVELARGDLDRAAEAAARSLTLADRSGIPFDRATAWLLQGEVASARRDGEVVAQAREVVAGLLTGMDMQPQAAMAVRLAAL